MDCLFCNIIDKKIPTTKIYEDENILAFNDISPQAPVHFLVIPKVHISSVDEISDENAGVISNIFKAIPRICKELNVENGYRIVTNVGENGGQTVQHLHFHVLGNRNLSWPPG